VQKEFGLRDQGSFVILANACYSRLILNPSDSRSPPGGSRLNILSNVHGDTVDVRIQQQFRDRRWMNLHPEHLDYQFTQIIFIGEKSALEGERVID